MINAQDVLGKMLETGMTPSAKGRIKSALNDPGPPQPGSDGGSLMDMLNKGGTPPSIPNILDNLTSMAKNMFGQAKQGVESGNPLAIGGLAALVGSVLGGGRGALGGAVGAGALAMLAKVAYDAMRQTGAGTAIAADDAPPLGMREPANEAERRELESRADLMLQAMINAAKADGTIDDAEMRRISGKLQETGAEPETVAFVNQHLREPADLEALIQAVPDKEVGLQVYAASLLAIEVDTPEEKDYLRRLADGLGLDAAAVANVHRILNSPG